MQVRHTADSIASSPVEHNEREEHSTEREKLGMSSLGGCRGNWERVCQTKVKPRLFTERIEPQTGSVADCKEERARIAQSLCVVAYAREYRNFSIHYAYT